MFWFIEDICIFFQLPLEFSSNTRSSTCYAVWSVPGVSAMHSRLNVNASDLFWCHSEIQDKSRKFRDVNSIWTTVDNRVDKFSWSLDYRQNYTFERPLPGGCYVRMNSKYIEEDICASLNGECSRTTRGSTRFRLSLTLSILVVIS